MERITGDADLWTLVLSRLALAHAVIAASTCKAHRSLLPQRSRHSLSLNTLHFGESEVNIMEAGRDSGGIDCCPKGYRPSPRVSDFPPLVEVTKFFPGLKSLRLHLPSREDLDRARSGIRLIDICTAFDIRDGPDPDDPLHDNLHGPLPLAIIACTKLEQIEFTSSSFLEGSLLSQAIMMRHSSLGVAQRLSHLLLSMLVPCRNTLRALDLSGVAAVVSATLLKLELPALTILRVGRQSPTPPLPSEDVWMWPDHLLPLFAQRFPSLTGLDMGYAVITRTGVSFRDIEVLCHACSSLRHLDLCFQTESADFGPALYTLGRHAPHLTSLAIHGLSTPTAALSALAAGCPQLSTLHLLACDFTDDGLLTFLRASHNLTHLDVSYGYVPAEVLITWVRERADGVSASCRGGGDSSSGRGGGISDVPIVNGATAKCVRELVMQGSYTTKATGSSRDAVTAESERNDLAKRLRELDMASNMMDMSDGPPPLSLRVRDHSCARLRVITGGPRDVYGKRRQIVEQRSFLLDRVWSAQRQR